MPELNLPTPGVTGGPGWASQLNEAITAVNDEIETGRLSETELSATIAEGATAVAQPRAEFGGPAVFSGISDYGEGVQAIGVGSFGGQDYEYVTQNPNGFRRTPNYGGLIYNATTPGGVTDAYATTLGVIEWGGYCYAIFRDSGDNRYKLYRAALTALGTAFTWSAPLLTLTTGGTGYGYALTTTSTSLVVAEYGDPVESTVKTARLYRSTDGTTFTNTYTLPSTARHFHCVKADPFNDGHVWASFGDNMANCYAISTDHGATWATLTLGQQWQGTQISFTSDLVYVAPDPGSLTGSLFAIDRETRTPRVASFGHHRALTVRDPGYYAGAQSTNGSTTLTCSKQTPFTANDVGRKVSGAGIPTGTTIAAYTNAGSVTLSAAATATQTDFPILIDRPERPRSNAFHGAVDPATGIYYGVTNDDVGSAAGTYARVVLFMVPYPGGPVIHLNDLMNTSGSHVIISPRGKVIFGRAIRDLVPALT